MNHGSKYFQMTKFFFRVGLSALTVASLCTISATAWASSYMKRELPEIASTPGDVDVTLTVLFDGDVPKGAIIKEYLPQGFEPVSSTPAYAAFDTVSREIKWVLFSSSMSQTMEISYRIRINTAQNVSFPFLGYLLYNDSQGMSQYLEATGDRNLETYSQHITVTRTLPITYVAPSTFESIIDIAIEGRSPNGLIITETLPVGVTAVSASLAWNSYDQATGQIKWVLIGQEVYSRSITYTVEPPNESNQELLFSGEIKYKDPLSQDVQVQIAGDLSVAFGNSVQQVSCIRTLPSICTLGEEIGIKLDVAIAGTAPNGIIISEKLPLGFQLVTSEPTYDVFDPSTQTVKWLLSESEVITRTINYTVVAPETSMDAEFAGSLIFNDVLGTEQTLIIKGNSVIPVNQRLIADAGAYQTTEEGSNVILDGSGSSNLDGEIAGYAWEQTEGPEVTLSNAATATPNFTAPEVGIEGAILIFNLTVMDNDGNSATDSVRIIVMDVCIPGDVNDDHKVDLEDALIVMKQLIYNRSYGAEVEAHSSDVNGDGRIGLHEAIYVLKHCAME